MSSYPPTRTRPSPRVIIYLIAIIACAWLMHRTSNRQQAASAPPPPASSSTATAPPVRLAPVVKEAELTSPDAERLPLLIILSADESTLPDDELRTKLQGFCKLLHLETNLDAQRHFQAEKVPVAILFDAESEEIARLQHPWTDEELLALAQKGKKSLHEK